MPYGEDLFVYLSAKRKLFCLFILLFYKAWSWPGHLMLFFCHVFFLSLFWREEGEEYM